MKHPSPLEQILNRCKHFNGIQHDACKADILYSKFMKSDYALVPLPCLRDDNSPDICVSVEWYTQEEAEVIAARHAKSYESVAVAVGKLLRWVVLPCKRSEERRVGKECA